MRFVALVVIAWSRSRRGVSPSRVANLHCLDPYEVNLGTRTGRRHHRRRLFLTILLLGTGAGTARAQGLIATFASADTAEHQRRFGDATRLYERAYGESGFDPVCMALAAGAAARAGLSDIAFRDLNRAIDEGFLDAQYFARDTDTFVLHHDPRWTGLESKLRERRAAIDSSLRQELLTLAMQDQQSRNGVGAVLARFGHASPQGDSVDRAIAAADAPRLERLKAIIAARGWPGRKLVADDGSHAAWLLVQHAPFDYQREVVPLFLSALRRNDVRAGDVALLRDRVLVGEGKAQIYGTQARSSDKPGAPVLDAIADEPCVDARRKSVGLEPLAVYLKSLGIAYDGLPGVCKAT